MTTSEVYQRRQLFNGIALVVIGLFIAGQSFYFNAQDRRQDAEARAQSACFQDKFRKLSEALEARAELTQRETAQNKKLWLIYADTAGIVRHNPTRDLSPEEQADLRRKLVAQLLVYKREIQKIERDRSRNPVPPYPAGLCG